jgi:hypothetical protein
MRVPEAPADYRRCRERSAMERLAGLVPENTREHCATSSRVDEKTLISGGEDAVAHRLFLGHSVTTSQSMPSAARACEVGPAA